MSVFWFYLFYIHIIYLSWYSECVDSGAGINVSLSSVEILS